MLGTGSTLTLDNTRPVGSIITATVTSFDGYGASDSASETIVIVNTEPSLDQAAEIVSTPSPKTTGLLTCSASFSDYNDGSLSTSYTWTLSDGTILATSGSNYTIDESDTNPGDEIVCTASASDNDGASISSITSVIVENTDPDITSFVISPDTSVEASATLEMQVSYSDIDNQGLNAVYEWRSPQGSLLGSSNILPLNSSYAVGANIIGIYRDRHQRRLDNTIRCCDHFKYKSNGQQSSQYLIITCTSDNRRPDLQCLVFRLQRRVLCLPLTRGHSSTVHHSHLSETLLTIDPNTTDPTDEIVCTASASDNDGASITSSTSVLVQNTAPSIDGFSITPGTT